MKNSESGSVFSCSVRSDFAFLKQTPDLESLSVRGINLEGSRGMLFPVCGFQAGDRQLMSLLSTWGDGGSAEEAAQWLVREVVEVPERVLFLVKDLYGNPVGQVGLREEAGREGWLEVCDVASVNSPDAEMLMGDALAALMRWARTTLWPEGFITRLGSSSARAPQFYGKLGFVEKGGADGGSSHVVMEAESDPVCNPGEKMILTAGPSISAREASYAYDAARYGWNAQWSKYLKTFEKGFAEYVGAKYAMATSSCTGALHIALAALGIGPGDEVIVPDITWVATANAVLYVGATPIFADIDPESWLLCPKSVREKITSRTKAIMPVHLYGHACDMDAIMAVAHEHGLYVVEDAAPSVGAEYHGKRTGSFGHFSCFSFQGAKLAVTGEGGMLLTSDPALYEKAYVIWDQGRKPGTFWIETNGLKYKMSNVQAAVGLGQLERNDAMVAAKRRIFRWYEEGLAGVPHVRLNREPEGTRSIYWMSSILVEESSPVSRDALGVALKARNIDTRPVFPAISQYPVWPLKQSALPMAKFVGDHAMNLPSGVCLAREEVAYVCREIRRAVGG